MNKELIAQKLINAGIIRQIKTPLLFNHFKIIPGCTLTEEEFRKASIATARSFVALKKSEVISTAAATNPEHHLTKMQDAMAKGELGKFEIDNVAMQRHAKEVDALMKEWAYSQSSLLDIPNWASYSLIQFQHAVPPQATPEEAISLQTSQLSVISDMDAALNLIDAYQDPDAMRNRLLSMRETEQMANSAIVDGLSGLAIDQKFFDDLIETRKGLRRSSHRDLTLHDAIVEILKSA